MNEPTPSQTPETDAKAIRHCANWSNCGDHVREIVFADFARCMERQRNEAIQARQQSAKEWADQVANADLRTARAKRERDEARAQRDALAEAGRELDQILPGNGPTTHPAVQQFRTALATLDLKP